MTDDEKQNRMVRLVAQAITAAVDSGMEPADVIACFGLASNVLLQQAVAGGAATLDPHTSFAKGLAQMRIKGIETAAYH